VDQHQEKINVTCSQKNHQSNRTACWENKSRILRVGSRGESNWASINKGNCSLKLLCGHTTKKNEGRMQGKKTETVGLWEAEDLCEKKNMRILFCVKS